MDQLQLAQQAEIEKLTKENELMRQLATTSGFYKFYFSECQKHETNKLAFEFVNDLYLKLFKIQRYADYDSFKNSLSYYNKTQKK